MNTPEKKDYPNLLLRLSKLLDALSHPARLQILMYLAKYTDCPAGSISENLPLCKSTVSEHLNKLKKAGFINYSPEGYCNNYQINDKISQELKTLLNEFIAQIEELKNHRTKCNKNNN